MTNDEIYNPKPFEEISEELNGFQNLYPNIKDKNSVQRISSNEVVVQAELTDLEIIWNRFISNRKKLSKILPQLDFILQKEGPNSERAERFWQEDRKLSAELKVDLKSLFLFGDIFFNKLTLFISFLVFRRPNAASHICSL